MKMVAMLSPILQDAVNWNRARVNFLCHFLIALLKVKTVNFAEIATAFSNNVKTASNYKRIQRFFRFYTIDFSIVAQLMAKMLSIRTNWILTLDRTNWKFGKSNINALVLAIAYKGIAFPIIWVLLPKRGNSNTEERMELMERFISIFSIERIQSLTADREFLGQVWFSYLIRKNIPFCIRIRENMKIANSAGILTRAKDIFRHLPIGRFQILTNPRFINGNRMYVIGLRLAHEYLILVTDHNPANALENYARRWEIETLFSCLKTRGFCFEETHLVDPRRIEKLIALLGIALAFAHITGTWLHEQKPIPIKKHGRKTRSFFRYGLDYLRKIVLTQSSQHLCDFQKAIRLLSSALSIPLLNTPIALAN